MGTGISVSSFSSFYGKEAFHSYITRPPACSCDFWEGVSPKEMIGCPATRVTQDGISCSPVSISIGGYAVYGASASLSWNAEYFMDQLTIIWSE